MRLRARWELAEAYLRSGNPFAAYEAYTMVTFGRDPDLAARACQRLARLEVDRGNALEAREWLSHLQDDGPVDASGRVDTAGCQDAQVCLTEALISLREAREAQAMAALAQVVERFPGTAASQRARQELRGLKASAARRK